MYSVLTVSVTICLPLHPINVSAKPMSIILSSMYAHPVLVPCFFILILILKYYTYEIGNNGYYDKAHAA